MGMSCWDKIIKSWRVFQIALVFKRGHLNYHMLQFGALKQFMLGCKLKQFKSHFMMLVAH